MQRCNAFSKKFVNYFLLAVALISLMAAITSAAVTPISAAAVSGTTSTQSLVGATTHKIEYQIGCPPSMVDDGTSLDYFKSHGFSVVHLVVPDKGTYQAELNTIKSLGMKPIIDVEIPIWNGGQLQSTPISNFSSYFQSLKDVGWEYVSSEGGRAGDLDYMAQFFKGYVNYNCDQCGLWKDMYKHNLTVMNSWESYYTSEWPYIQNGSKEAASLGKQNGILAGVWEYGSDGVTDYNPILTNSKNGNSPSYKSMLDWSYANGIGFNHFHVWCGDNAQGLSRYKALGFEQIVADLQATYPPLAAWTVVGGAVASGTGPATCAQDANSTDLFVQGTDNALWYKHYTSGSGWSAWKNLGGVLSADPAAVSQSSGKIDVFVRGTDGALWTKSTTDGGSSWSSWSKIGGQLASGTGPATCSWGNGRLDLFVQGTDNVLWHKSYTGTWSGWESLGGSLTSSPGATSQTSGAIDVFVRGTDGAVWQRAYSSNAWGSWKSPGGSLASGTGPATCSWGNGRLDLFVQGTDNVMWHKSYTGTWSGWEPRGGTLTSSPAAAASGGNKIDVFVRGSDGAVWEESYIDNAEWGSF